MYKLKLISENGLTYLTSKELLEQGIFLAFTTRQKGVSPNPYDSLNLAFHVHDHQQNVIKNRQLLADNFDFDLGKLTCAKQVHGNKAVYVEVADAGQGATDYDSAIEGTDALATDLIQSPLAIFFADCLPVVLVSLEPKMIAIAHAGFKGLLNDVIKNTVTLFNGRVSTTKMLAFLGPAIGPSCYKVDRDRIKQFNAKFHQTVKAVDNSLDFKKIATFQLERAGLKPKNIYSTDYCTCCNDELFFSYRRNNVTGRQAAISYIR